MEQKIISVQEGMTFSSYQELEVFVNAYYQYIKLYFVKKHSTKCKPADEKLVYSNIEYCCKFGGNRKSESTGQRVSSTYCYGCPAFFKVRVKNKSVLEIYWTDLEHKNHPDNAEDFFFAIPQNRRLPAEVLAEILKMLNMGGKHPKIKNYIAEKYGIYLENKDIQNKKALLTNKCGNDLNELTKLLKENDCSTNVLHDEENQFKGIYFSTGSMRKAMAAWPQILFVDGTYSLSNLGYILLLMLVPNAIGRAEIVGAAMVKNEDSATFDWFVEVFKQQNSDACLNIKCVMSDKHKAQRNAFRKHLPSAKLYLCMFHTLQSFSREIKKFKLGKQSCSDCLQLLKQLVYSSSPEEYDNIYCQFSKAAPECVIKYFNDNWHPIRNEWCKFNMNEGNSGYLTNNLLESTNRDIKRVCGRRKSLVNFVNDFFQYHKSQCQQTDLLRARQQLKKPRVPEGTEEVIQNYTNFLTSRGVEKLILQFKSFGKVRFTDIDAEKKTCTSEYHGNIIKTTITTCTCAFFSSFGLPCSHIFGARNQFNVDLYCEELCEPRWSKSYENRKCGFFPSGSGSPKNVGKETAVSFSVAKTRKVQTVAERRRRMLVLTNELANIASTSTGDEFARKEKFLENVRKAWIEGLDVQMVIAKEDTSEISDAVRNLSLNAVDSEEEHRIRNIIQPTPIKIRGRPKGLTQTTPKVHFKNSKK